MKQARSAPLTNTKDGIITALKNEAGAIPNEALNQQAKSKHRRLPVFEKLSGHVLQSRPPVHEFACDDCGFDSYGWRDMTQHVEKTGHLNYTAKDVE